MMTCWNTLHAQPSGYCPDCMTAWDLFENVKLEEAKARYERELAELDKKIADARWRADFERTREPRNLLKVAEVKRTLNTLLRERKKKEGTR